MTEVRIGDVVIGARDLVLIAGPCVIESAADTLRSAQTIRRLAQEVGIPFIFKTSYDKANRSSIKAYRGPGIKKGREILKRVKEEIGIPIITDIHCQTQIDIIKDVVDVFQIPAYLSRQTDLITSVAQIDKPINIKKGQFMSPMEMVNVIEKIESVGNKQILLTERGVSFGYNNLVSDLRSLMIMRRFNYPVVYDATHSVQLPAAGVGRSLGQREFVRGLARAAVAVGCDALFLEVHPDPDNALCDGPNMIDFLSLKRLLIEVKEINQIKDKYA